LEQKKYKLGTQTTVHPTPPKPLPLSSLMMMSVTSWMSVNESIQVVEILVVCGLVEQVLERCLGCDWRNVVLTMRVFIQKLENKWG